MPLFVLAADPPADKDKKLPALRVGANVPGPFHPYNVTGRFGPQRIKDKTTQKEEDVEGRYHCPVTEHGEDPMVLVFTRDLEVGDKLKSLLQKLDTVTAANKDKVRLGATVVFLDKELPEVVGSSDATDDRRRELAASLREKFAGMFKEDNPFTKQKLVVVCIGSDADLAKYELDRNHKATVVLYNKLEIRAVHDVEDLDDARIDAIMQDVADKLGAKRK